MIRELKKAPEGLLLAMKSMRDGNSAVAISCIDEAIARESRSSGEAELLFCRADLHSSLGDRGKAIEDYTAVIALSGAPAEQVAKALVNRGITYFQKSQKEESQSDFEALIRLPEAPPEKVVKASLALSELHFSEGRWSEGFQALEASLECGAKAQPAYRETATDLIGVVFSAGLSPEGRRDKVTDLLRIYGQHQPLPVLGEAVVQHIGSVYRAKVIR